MSALEWLSNIVTGAGMAVAGQACPLPDHQVVVVRPLEQPLQRDFTKTSVGINQMTNKPVAVPVPHTARALGGLMLIEMSANTNVEFGGATARDNSGACVWPAKVTIDLVLAGTLFVNQIYEEGTCMHNAIAEHEMEHYTQGKALVLRELKTVQQAAKAVVDKIGVLGPMPPEQAQQQGKPIGDAITAAVQTEIDRLNKEQEQLQVAHDSAIENLETLTACRGAGRFVHQPPLVPGGQATGGQDG